MKQPEYTHAQRDIARHALEEFKKKNYVVLKHLADEKFNDTEHPHDDVQIGVDIFYDDKKLGHVRVSVALYVIKERPWWHFWDSAVLVESFIIAPDGTLVDDRAPSE